MSGEVTTRTDSIPERLHAQEEKFCERSEQYSGSGLKIQSPFPKLPMVPLTHGSKNFAGNFFGPSVFEQTETLDLVMM